MDVISGDFYNFSDITFSIQSSLTTLISGEAKAFILIMVYQEVSFLNNYFTTLDWQEQNTTCTKTTRIKSRGIGMATQIIKK